MSELNFKLKYSKGLCKISAVCDDTEAEIIGTLAPPSHI